MNTGSPASRTVCSAWRSDTRSRASSSPTERLADVVVGAGVARRDLVLLLAARRQHDDRHAGPLAERADHLEPVHVRQAEVEHHDVRLSRGRLAQSLFARHGLEQR
jgi:hypothetical protein